MATLYLTEASPGAPTLNGVNGSLCAVLDWALPQNGWAIEYTNGANARVYRPATGNRNRLHVNHDSAVSGNAALATVRGCENATDAVTLVDPFPTVAQVANNSSTVLVTASAGATARGFNLIVTPTFFLLAINAGSSATTGWDIMAFGDLPGTRAEDVYATMLWMGGTTTTTSSFRAMGSVTAGYIGSTNKVFFCRSIDGTVKSTRGCLWAANTSNTGDLGQVGSAPVMRGGYLNQIVRDKVAATCTGSSSASPGPLSIMRRGWIPNLWNPIHSGIGGVTADDAFTDTAYAADSRFVIVPASTTVAAIIETSDTWVAPSG